MMQWLNGVGDLLLYLTLSPNSRLSFYCMMQWLNGVEDLLLYLTMSSNSRLSFPFYFSHFVTKPCFQRLRKLNLQFLVITFSTFLCCFTWMIIHPHAFLLWLNPLYKHCIWMNLSYLCILHVTLLMTQLLFFSLS